MRSWSGPCRNCWVPTWNSTTPRCTSSPHRPATPFPLHQDNPFYGHQDGRYIDVLVHLDDTRHENGEIRFLAGSHKSGHLQHITETDDGPCAPHLPRTDTS